MLIEPIVRDQPDIIILVTTGPPCVDFSRLRHQPPGTDGDQGRLLQRTIPPHHPTLQTLTLGDSLTSGTPTHSLADCPDIPGESTWQRWDEHQRQFAPWQYQPQYLTRYQDGPWQPIVLKKLHQHRVDEHWQMMADEIAKEVQMGRTFSAPDWWDRPAVALATHEHTKHLKPLPHSTPLIAVAFSIHQTGSDGQPKVRRGDWRRSGHNRSCNMADQPHRHAPDHYVWLAQHTAHYHTSPLHVWGHDGAYRQLPLQDPSLAYVLLLTPDGWSYNRFGDMLTFITRGPDSHTSGSFRG